MSDHSLLPCPFCGSRHVLLVRTKVFWVLCEDCGAEGPIGAKSEPDAIEKWNAREKS